MSVLDSLIPTFDDEVAGIVLPRPVEELLEASPMNVSHLVDYSDDDMPALETGIPALEATKYTMPELESYTEAETQTEAQVEADESEDVEGTVEEHPLEKNPFDESPGINTCIYVFVFLMGMMTAFVLTKMTTM